MTTPNDTANDTVDDTARIGPQPRPSDDELAAMPTVKIPRGRPRQVRRGGPLLVVAAVNTLLATVVCVAVVVVVVLLAQLSLGERLSGGEILVALAGWLLAHGIPVKASIGDIALAPLSITMLVVWRLSRAGVHTARGSGARDTGSVRQALSIAGVIGVGYGLIGAVAAAVVDRPELTVTPWRAGLHLLVIGALAALLGSIRTTGALRQIARVTPLLVRDGVRTGTVAALFLLGLGAGATGLVTAISGGQAAQIFGAYPSGVAGQAGVTLVCLAFAPNVAVWAAAYLLGPGFVVGAGTMIQPAGVVLGAMPPLPVLSGVPERGLEGPLWALMALPVIAGAVANLLLVRRRLRPRRTRTGDTVVPVPRWARMFGSAVLGGIVAGVVTAAVTLAASGHLDGGQPYPVGAPYGEVALFATLAIGLGGLLGVAAAYVWKRWPRRRSHLSTD